MEGGGSMAECGLGSIVWVRRRNGSWWPGKILGPQELPASHLTSPRTGTPVKLLGREDASVDWYNLEKSKRVKAFRCGEFDDCIERAEAAQGMPPKKREKYARREDAILHALELEKELLRKQGKLDMALDNSRSKSTGSVKKDSGESDVNTRKPQDLKSSQLLKRQDTLNKAEKLDSPLLSENDKDGDQPSVDTSNTELVPQMKVFQDLRLKYGSGIRKPKSSDPLGSSMEPTLDDIQAPSGSALSIRRISHSNGERMQRNSRAKRSRCVYIPAESSDVLNYKDLNKIGMSHSMFRDVGLYHFPGYMAEDSSCGFVEDVQSDCSESSSESEFESDSSETEVDMDDEFTSLSGATVPTDIELDTLQRPEALEEGGSVTTGESDESSLSGDISHHCVNDPLSVSQSVSKWQLKGKRNIRNLAKRPMNNEFSQGICHDDMGAAFIRKPMAQWSYRNDDFRYGVDNRGHWNRLEAVSSSRHGFGRNMSDWIDMPWENRASMKRRWEDRAGHFDPMFVGNHHFGGRTRSMLMDVNVKVQAGYQKEPVPIVSLMSKLDGKAIIGHPIQIEVVDDGSAEVLVPSYNYFGNGLTNHKGNAALPPAWRTAKRTNFRVPRPHLSAALGVDDAAEGNLFLDQGRNPPFKKYHIGSLDQRVGVAKKSTSHSSRGATTDKKLSRKLPKKVSISSSQKTRTLSSIGIQHNLGPKPFQDRNSHQTDGIIKSESGPTTVACIPVKLVFSRLLEKINRPPSKAPGKIVLHSGNAGKEAA